MRGFYGEHLDPDADEFVEKPLLHVVRAIETNPSEARRLMKGAARQRRSTARALFDMGIRVSDHQWAVMTRMNERRSRVERGEINEHHRYPMTPALSGSIDYGDGVTWSGGHLHIRGRDLPETVVAALPGCRLSTLVQHPMLPDMTISSVTRDICRDYVIGFEDSGSPLPRYGPIAWLTAFPRRLARAFRSISTGSRYECAQGLESAFDKTLPVD